MHRYYLFNSILELRFETLKRYTVKDLIKVTFAMPAYLVNRKMQHQIYCSDDYFDVLWKSACGVSKSASSCKDETAKKRMVILENGTMDVTILSPISLCQIGYIVSKN